MSVQVVFAAVGGARRVSQISHRGQSDHVRVGTGNAELSLCTIAPLATRSSAGAEYTRRKAKQVAMVIKTSMIVVVGTSVQGRGWYCAHSLQR